MTLETLLVIAGLLHFTLLPVSLAVPRVMNWKRELAPLSLLNRQIIWVHGAYIFLLIAAFGAITLMASGPMADGTEQGPILSGLIGFFWLGRLIIQLFYYDPRDWPTGAVFILGRYALTALFTFWSVVYMLAFVSALLRNRWL